MTSNTLVSAPSTATDPTDPSDPTDPAHNDELLPIQGYIQNYAWGLRGSSSLAAQLYAQGSGSGINESLPYAELWFGSHKSGPSTLPSRRDIELGDFLRQRERESMPFLFKVLSVHSPLSIQAHPDKIRAAKLHKERPHKYKDDNHKPEMCVALTDFEGMCNFRSISDIIAFLRSHKPLCHLVGGDDTLAELISADSDSNSNSTPSSKSALRNAFSSLMNASTSAVSTALEHVSHSARVYAQDDALGADALFLRLLSYYPGDPGCFCAYFLNHVRLPPGGSFFMAANEPHAYLSGQCVEAMAVSDNVVRAGLTPKYRDVETLVEMLTYGSGEPDVVQPMSMSKFECVYRPPVEEFQVAKVAMPMSFKDTVTLQAHKGPSVVLTVAGTGWISVVDKDEQKLPLAPGKSYLLKEGCAVMLQAHAGALGSDSGELLVFRCSANQAMRE